ncbi:hypothetical protein AM1_5980 [Acaryochloris marina MBIC11017]|uniref:Uncharacterized protein n=1 Tax=Acaryochloris marina (strain MBIC 11017) TaxID=329726 RepID=B0C2M8_ACAM1|nr:hypothetical protein AM1_5980 [Acaryochloris marina MBIC11017]
MTFEHPIKSLYKSQQTGEKKILHLGINHEKGDSHWAREHHKYFYFLVKYL